ncbi:MAG: hypothetical protein CL556_12975 [Alphaproteobacteria bacterium]|nr:hypothetical protein [Alphaproteobacteria bacterium]
MPGYMMKDKKKKKMYGYGGEVKKKKMYGGGGSVIKDLETAAINAMSKLTHLKMKHYNSKKIK